MKGIDCKWKLEAFSKEFCGYTEIETQVCTNDINCPYRRIK